MLKKSPNANETVAPSVPGEVVALNLDLFFGVKIGNQLKEQGYGVAFRKTAADFADRIRLVDAVLGVIDLNAKPDWNEIASLTSELGERTPIIVFGSHLDVEGLRAAKAAGVRRVVSNGEFHRSMIDLVKRYARATE